MKKTTYFVAITVLSAVMVSLTVSSCSPEYTEEELNDYSLSKKEKIERLAEEYGLNVEMKMFPVTRSDFSIDDIEEEFKTMSSILGDYEIIGKQNGESIMLCGLESNLFNAGVMAAPNVETGNKDLSYIQYETIKGSNGNNLELRFEIVISLSWDFSIHNEAEITGAVINELNSGSTMHPSVTNESVSVSGGTPTISFSCDLNLTGILGSYYYKVSGDYCPTTQVGSLHVI